MRDMAKTISLQVSKDALKNLTKLAKSSGLSKDKALRWVLLETAVPVIQKRGKAQRTEALAVRLDDCCTAIIATVSAQYKVGDSAVVEAYLARTY